MPSPGNLRRALAVGLAFAAITVGLMGQNPRVSFPGRVLGVDGEPLAGAEVTFLTVDSTAGFGDEDVVRTTSAANGRLVVKLLPTRRYQAWATHSTAAGTVVSEMVRRALPITEIRFTANHDVPPERWEIRGAEAWREIGPLRVQIVVEGVEGLVPDAEVSEDGFVPLPPLPAERIGVRVFAGGRLIHASSANTRRPLTVPPPHRIAIRTVDIVGEPLAGVEVHRVTLLWRRSTSVFPSLETASRHLLATSDDDGRAEVWIASEKDPWKGVGYPIVALVAARRGFADTVAGFAKSPFSSGEVVMAVGAAAPDRTLTIAMIAHELPAASIRAAGTNSRQVAFLGRHNIPLGKGSHTSSHDCVVVDVVEGGQTPIHSVPRGYVPLTARIPNVIPKLAAGDPFVRAVTPRSLVLLPGWFADNPKLDLREVVPLRVQVLDESAGAAMGIEVLAVPKGPSRYLEPEAAVAAEADAAGRFVLPAMPGPWLVITTRGDHWAMTTCEVAADMPVVALKLKPMERHLVRVVDQEGKPVSGVRFRSNGSMWRTKDAPEAAFLRDVGNSIAMQNMSIAVTDAQGRAAIPFLECSGLRVDCIASVGKLSSEVFALQALDDYATLVVR